MKWIAFLFALALPALSQTPSGTAQVGKDCVVNISGNNNTGSVTCIGVDRKLAEQIRDLVNSAKGNATNLKEISNQLAKILAEIEKPQSSIATTVMSVDQQGGITAGTVNITGTNAVKITITNLSLNELTRGPNGSFYRSTYRVRFSGQVPRLAVEAYAATLLNMEFKTSSLMQMGVVQGKKADGTLFYQSDNVFGVNTLMLDTTSPDHFKVRFRCESAQCVIASTQN